MRFMIFYDSWGRELNQLNKINQNKTETYRNEKELNKHNLYAVNLTLKLDLLDQYKKWRDPR